MAEAIVCTKCRTALPALLINRPDLVPCPVCGSRLLVEVYPAFLKAPVVGSSGERLLVEGESSCFYHPQKKAVIPCESCGRFLCALCNLELNGQHLCPACLETGKTKGKLKNLENHRTVYDNVALALAIFPLLIFYLTLITAPLTLYLAIRYWHAPTSIIPRRTKLRLVIAMVLAALQILGWIVLLYMALNG